MSFARIALFWIVCAGPVILGQATTVVDECDGSEAVDECYRKLQTFLRLLSLPYTTSSEELDGFCQNSIGGYNCSQRLARSRCVQDKDRQLMPMFASMAEIMYQFICQNGTVSLREDLLSHSQCILDNRVRVECCEKGTHIPDLPVMRILEESSKSMTTREQQTCCPVSRHLECVSAVISAGCGEAAANFTRNYIRRAAGEQVQYVCQSLPGYPETISCPDAAPDCTTAGTSTTTALSLLLLTAAILLLTGACARRLI